MTLIQLLVMALCIGAAIAPGWFSPDAANRARDEAQRRRARRRRRRLDPPSLVLLAIALSGCALDTSEIRAMADRPNDDRVTPVDAGAGDVAPDVVQLADVVPVDVQSDQAPDVPPDASCPAVCPDLYRCTDQAPLCCREVCGGDCSSCGAGDRCTAIAGGCVVCCVP